MLKYDLNLREYWRIIKRRKFIILFTCILMGVFSFVSAILGKPVPIYKTSAAVKVEKTQSAMGFNMPGGGVTNIETQTIMIKSYYILELTAKKMGLIPENLSSEDVRNNPKYITAILELKDKVAAEQEGSSDLINIIITANDPKFAARFANTLAEVYQTQHTLDLNRRTIEGKKFVETQFVSAKEKMMKSEEAIKKFREDNRWTSVDSESSYTLTEVKRLQSQLNQEQIVYQKLLIAERALIDAESHPLTSRTSFYFEEASPPYKALNDKLVGYMVDRDTLLLTYTDNFPQIRAIRSQVNDTIAGMRAQLRVQKNSLLGNQRVLKQQIAQLEGEFKKLPEKGLELARLEREAAVNREVYTLLEKKYQEILIAVAEKIEEVKIVKPALEPTAPINPPKIGNNAAIGTMMGLILGVVFAFLIETFDTSIGAIEEVEEFLGVHVLGVIPFVSPEEIRLLLSDDKGNLTVEESKLPRYTRMAAHFVPSSTLAESYKAFRTSLNFVCMEGQYKSLVLTSSSPSEGKTSTTVNLALTMAQTGHRVLLIDGDLRRPVVSSVFGIEQVPGLTDVIMGNYEWHNVVRTISDYMMGNMTVEEVMLTPGMDNLHIITSGTYAPNPAEIIGSKSIGEFMRQARAEYDMVLVDAPPVLAATDAALWSSQVDATVLVYQVGKIARGALKRAKMQLDAIKTNIIGVVLNGIRAEISTDFTYHDYYYYHYRYGGDKGKSKKPWYKDILANLSLDRIMNYGQVFKKRYSQHYGRGGKKLKKNEQAAPGETKGIENATAAPNVALPDRHDGASRYKRGFKKEIVAGFLQKHLPILKIVIAVLAALFLALGILYQFDYLKAFLPGRTAKAAKSAMPAKMPPPVATQGPAAAKQTPGVAAKTPPAAGGSVANNSSPSGVGNAAAETATTGAQTFSAVTPPDAKEKVAAETAITGQASGAAAAAKVKLKDKFKQKGAATVAAPTKPFAIQIKAVPSKADADVMVNSLRAAGLDAYAEGVDIKGKGRWMRIFVGAFPTREAAQTYLQENKLDQKHQGAFIAAR